MTQLTSINTIFEKKIRGHLPVCRLSVSNTGSVIVAVPDSFQTRLYSLVSISPSGEETELGSFSVETPNAIDFSENGQVFVAMTADDVYVFRNWSKCRFFPNRRENYIGISIAASGESVAVVSADMIASTYAVNLCRTSGPQSWNKNFPNSLSCLRMSADGSRILVGSDDGKAVMLDNCREVVWEIDSDDPITCVSVSDKGKLSVLGTKGGAIQAVSAAGERIWEGTGDYPISDCAVSRDGKLIAGVRNSEQGSGTLEIYNTEGNPLTSFDAPSQIRSVACSPDGRHLAISCEDGTLQILEVTLAPQAVYSADKANSLFAEAGTLVEAGELSKAVEKLTLLLKLSPCHLDGCRKLIEVQDALVSKCVADADRLASEGNLEGSFVQIQTAVGVRPFDVGIQQKFLGAREQLVAGLLSESDRLSASGDLEEAAKRAEAAIELDITSIQAREQLCKVEDAIVSRCIQEANTASDKESFDEAIQMLEQAVAIRPLPEVQAELSKARVRQALNTGVALYEAKRYTQALLQFRKVLNLDPSNEEAERYMEFCGNLHKDDTLYSRFSKLE